MGFIVNILQADIFICEDKVVESRGDFHGQGKSEQSVPSLLVMMVMMVMMMV